ncbi:MAG: type III secretion system stator protein SctL, partial [Bilophila sp.]
EKLMETAMSSVTFIEGIETTLVDVVVQALRKIVGDMPPEERIVGVIRQALTTVRNQQRVTLRVSPTDEAAVRTAFASMLQRMPGEASFLDLLVDARLEIGACILESELGVVDASVQTQLKAMENAFKVKIAR